MGRWMATNGTESRGQAVWVCPFTVQVDTAEQLPYTFQGLRTNADKGNKPIEVPTVRKHLKTGDYSILGHHNGIVIERKSKEDLYASVARRENFEDRLNRMEEIHDAGGLAFIMVENGRRHVINHPPKHSDYNPKALNRTILAWEIRYRAKWMFIGGRDYAEAMTFRILERWWAEYNKGK